MIVSRLSWRQVMVTNVTSLLKTVKAVEDEATRGTRALEATIECIKQELTVRTDAASGRSAQKTSTRLSRWSAQTRRVGIENRSALVCLVFCRQSWQNPVLILGFDSMLVVSTPKQGTESTAIYNVRY